MTPRPRRKFNRPQPVRAPRRNEQIRAPQVRLINEKGENIGIVKREEALEAARSAGLDLIEITEKTDPPVVRIMDYGKYKYQQGKKGKDTKKKQVSGITKGVRISMRTSEHDMGIKALSVDKFLKKGYKIRVELFMRGREKGLKDLAHKKIGVFLDALTEEYTIDQKPTTYPRGLYLTLRSN